MLDAGLYQLEKKDINQIAEMLTECFQQDPLYRELIPDDALRKKVLPEFFECYLDMAYNYCRIYADGPEINGIAVVFDTIDPDRSLSYSIDVALCCLRFVTRLLHGRFPLKTLIPFIKNSKFLTSSWEEEIEAQERLHIDYFAVRPQKRGNGLATQMMSRILEYADCHHCLTTVETHNRKNLGMYQHYGFRLFRTLSNGSQLQEYCMVRE